MFGKDVDKGSVARFLWLTVYYINQFLNVLYVSLYHCNNKLHTVPCTEKPRNYSRLMPATNEVLIHRQITRQTE